MPNNADKTRTALTRLDERVGLPYSAFLAAGSGITLTFDQAAGTYTISAAAGGVGSFTAFSITGVLTPAQLANATTDNWAPGSFAAASRVEFTTAGAAAAISGMAGGVADKIVILTNIGANILTVLNENAGSLAANRFEMNGDLIIPPKASALFIYSTAVGCWSGISI